MKRVLEPECMASEQEARSYDALAQSRMNALLEECFVQAALKLGVRQGRVLDIGAGPGWIPIRLARLSPGMELLGVDSSEAMLAVAAKNARRAGLADVVRFEAADAKALAYPDDSFDLVLSHQTLHHLERPEQMLAEAARVLRPGGALLIRDVVRPPAGWLVKWYARVFGAGYDAEQRRMFEDSLRAALTPQELARAARRVGLAGFSVRRNFLTHISLAIRAPNGLHSAGDGAEAAFDFHRMMLGIWYGRP